ncbi:uncharacterized protein BJ212DRAFT_1299940 [Suillus subaureus]|uniref:Uncharacterized protein n=1 Tax=Suillus subaureus TaxID=48587 RepID=A0A9P7JDF2_9AGAM|nr:uncharacterized protein BJ212DRAFT_1299940 [Suillus subaureus]KAG1816117.1 hypothetical protein BJ212DRAFT_1299940 [Suillus subaureus]
MHTIPTIPPDSSSSTSTYTSTHAISSKVLDKLQTSAGGYYAAMPKLTHHAEFFAGRCDSNMLVVKDANFDPANVFHGHLADVKLNYRLTAVLDNLCAFEKLVPSKKDYKTFSVIYDSLGQRSIKLTHNLFNIKTFDDENQHDTTDARRVDSDDSTSDDLGPEFDFATWPVAE